MQFSYNCLANIKVQGHMADVTYDRGWAVRWQLERPTSPCKRNSDVPQRLISPKAEERRYFGYMGGHLERGRHVLPVSDWLAEFWPPILSWIVFTACANRSSLSK